MPKIGQNWGPGSGDPDFSEKVEKTAQKGPKNPKKPEISGFCTLVGGF